MEKFSKSLKEYAMEIINFKKKKMKLLPKELQELYGNGKMCYICREKLKNKYMKDKNYDKGRHRCHYRGKYRGAAHGIYNLKHSVLKKIPEAFPNRSKYNYYFIIKKLVEKFDKNTC